MGAVGRRVVLGSGWRYKHHINQSHLGKEGNVLGSYLDILHEMLFEGKRGPEGGIE